MESETENSETAPAVKNKAPCYYAHEMSQSFWLGSGKERR